jgi:hypothetical protein
MSYDNLSSVSKNVLKFYQQLTDEERRGIQWSTLGQRKIVWVRQMIVYRTSITVSIAH